MFFGYLLDEINYHFIKSLFWARSYIQGKQKRVVLVNGAPRSGTTWTVSIIAAVPGYRHIGNFQRDLTRYQTVKPGDVIHGHDHYSEALKDIIKHHDIKVVLPMRDLRDQIVSRLFHIRRTPNHAWQLHLQNMSNEEGLMACIDGLDPKTFPGVVAHANITRTWLANYPEVIPIRYEDLIANTEESMASVFSKLEIEIPQPILKLIINRKSFQRMTAGRKFWQQGRKPGVEAKNLHIRKGIVGDWKNHFKPEHIQHFKEVAGDILIELGYEKDLNW